MNILRNKLLITTALPTEDITQNLINNVNISFLFYHNFRYTYYIYLNKLIEDIITM
jgi:hypothetical protein